MRLASSTETADVITKVITNHNHTRALTLQYWDVLRLFDVTTTVDGVTLVCLVPLQVLHFLPAGQPLQPTTTTGVGRAEILTRYGNVLKHTDILERTLPRQYRYGLSLLKQFASDPIATIQAAGAAAEDVIHFMVDGTFLPIEEIYVSAVTKRGTRIGPVRLTGDTGVIPEVIGDPAKSFATQDALIANLRDRRNAATGFRLQGYLAVPPDLARNDIIGFEIRRRFQQLDYDLVNPSVQTIKFFGITINPDSPPDHLISGTVHLSPQPLTPATGAGAWRPLHLGFQRQDPGPRRRHRGDLYPVIHQQCLAATTPAWHLPHPGRSSRPCAGLQAASRDRKDAAACRA